MIAIAAALAELRRGWDALLLGFPDAAGVHLECARERLKLAEYPAHRGMTVVKAWLMTDQLADAVRQARITGQVSGNCTCIDNRDAAHRHAPLGCVVAGCGCVASEQGG